MGIPGLRDELGSGERISLAKYSINHLHRTSRSLRIAVDISIWLYQVQAAQGGHNPALRTLFFRLTRLTSLPIQPLFVFDGPQRPEYKRGKWVSRSGGAGAQVALSRKLIELFSFPCHNAPGEAEAECAKLQATGVVDAVMSNDVDALMFGSKVTMLNFSKETSKHSAAATHVNIYCTEAVKDELDKNVALDKGGMVLFALLSGGDYTPAGVSFCGRKLAAEIAQAGFGIDLLEAAANLLETGNKNPSETLTDWRERLQYELDTNESGYFRTKHKAVKIPDGFPDLQALRNCVNPITSKAENLEKFLNSDLWNKEIDIEGLRAFVSDNFGWKSISGAKGFIKKFAPSLVSHQLLHSPSSRASMKICAHNLNAMMMDGLPAFKIEYTPAQVVGLNLELESTPNSQETVEGQFSDEDEDRVEHPLPTKRGVSDYDPTVPQTVWIFEAIVKLGMPGAVRDWNAAQEEKAAAKKRPSKKVTRKKSRPKLIDPGMKVGAIRQYGTIVKRPLGGSSDVKKPSSKPKPTSRHSHEPEGSRETYQAIDNSPTMKGNRHEIGKRDLSPEWPSDLSAWDASSDLEVAMNFEDSGEGKPQFVTTHSSSTQSASPNTQDSITRPIDQVKSASHRVHTSSSPPPGPDRLPQADTNRQFLARRTTTPSPPPSSSPRKKLSASFFEKFQRPKTPIENSPAMSHISISSSTSSLDETEFPTSDELLADLSQPFPSRAGSPTTSPSPSDKETQPLSSAAEESRRSSVCSSTSTSPIPTKTTPTQSEEADEADKEIETNETSEPSVSPAPQDPPPFTITIQNGRWTGKLKTSTSQAESTDPMNPKNFPNSNIEVSGRDKKSKKPKRIGRVSILDLT